MENLRGGPDAWDPTLILKAGEIARDLGFALRIEPVHVALAPGSPLDDLDEALRSAESGGIGSFFAKTQAPQDPRTAVVAGLADDHRQDLGGCGLARLGITRDHRTLARDVPRRRAAKIRRGEQVRGGGRRRGVGAGVLRRGDRR